MSEITKEELLAMIEVQTKSATSMENIANSLKQVSEQNKEFVKAQQDLVKASIEEREKCTANICLVLKTGLALSSKEVETSRTVIDKIKEDTFWVKVIFGSIAFIVAIVSGIMAFSHHLATMAGK